MAVTRGPTHSVASTNVADLLERVLDKGVVIAGDIKVSLLDIELLTIQIRLVICSVDKAKEMGMDWWANSPVFSPTPIVADAPAIEAAEVKPGLPESGADITALTDRIAQLEREVAEARGAAPVDPPGMTIDGPINSLAFAEPSRGDPTPSTEADQSAEIEPDVTPSPPPAPAEGPGGRSAPRRFHPIDPRGGGEDG